MECTGATRRLRVEIMQYLLVVKYFCCYRCGICIRDYRSGLVLKIWWNFRFDWFVMNDIAYVNSIKSLQTTVSERNVYLFHSLKNLWSAISKTVAVIGILSKMKMEMQQYDEKLYYTRQCVFFLYDWQKFRKTNIVTCSYSVI